MYKYFSFYFILVFPLLISLNYNHVVENHIRSLSSAHITGNAQELQGLKKKRRKKKKKKKRNIVISPSKRKIVPCFVVTLPLVVHKTDHSIVLLNHSVDIRFHHLVGIQGTDNLY